MQPSASLQAYLDNKLVHSLEDHRPDYERIMFFTHKLKPFQPGQTFLEIGCGAGWSSILAAQAGYTVTGLDVRPEFVQAARQHAGEMNVAASFLVGNAEQVELPPQSFDVVYAQCVLEHVRGWEQAVAGMVRVLKPGGALYLSTTNLAYPISTEVEFPFYQYLPRPLQERIAKSLKGQDVMEFGFAWNYFTHPMLRSHLKKLGLAPVYDILDLLDYRDIHRPWVQKLFPLISLARRFYPLKWMMYIGLSITALYALKPER